MPNRLPDERRDFFADLLKEIARPVTKLYDRRVQPLLKALDAASEFAEGKKPSAAPRTSNLFRKLPILPPAPQGLSAIPRRTLRPPGALPPEQFAETCSTCGKCVEVCPAHAIKIDPAAAIAGGLPYIVAAEQPCVLCTDLSCTKHCPSGALRLVDRAAIHMGVARVNHETCRRTSGENCRLCVETCPMGESAILIGEKTGKVRVRSGCTGCGLCEQACPTQPKSIIISPHLQADVIVVA